MASGRPTVKDAVFVLSPAGRQAVMDGLGKRTWWLPAVKQRRCRALTSEALRSLQKGDGRAAIKAVRQVHKLVTTEMEKRGGPSGGDKDFTRCVNGCLSRTRASDWQTQTVCYLVCVL